jgi:hypothetical protein
MVGVCKQARPDVIVDPDVTKYVDQLLKQLESTFSSDRQHVWEGEQSMGNYFH